MSFSRVLRIIASYAVHPRVRGTTWWEGVPPKSSATYLPGQVEDFTGIIDPYEFTLFYTINSNMPILTT